jgi:hypothetical protein
VTTGSQQVLILNVFLPIAHVVWLWNLTSSPGYVTLNDQIYGQTKHLGIGNFSLTMGVPWPFSQVDSWLFLTDASRIAEITPTVCVPNSNGTCHAYVMFANPIDYTYACNVNDTQCVDPEAIICPSNEELCVINGLFRNVPGYVVEFEKQRSNLSYDSCHPHTSELGTEVLMWLQKTELRR